MLRLRRAHQARHRSAPARSRRLRRTRNRNRPAAHRPPSRPRSRSPAATPASAPVRQELLAPAPAPGPRPASSVSTASLAGIPVGNQGRIGGANMSQDQLRQLSSPARNRGGQRGQAGDSPRARRPGRHQRSSQAEPEVMGRSHCPPARQSRLARDRHRRPLHREQAPHACRPFSAAVSCSGAIGPQHERSDREHGSTRTVRRSQRKAAARLPDRVSRALQHRRRPPRGRHTPPQANGSNGPHSSQRPVSSPVKPGAACRAASSRAGCDPVRGRRAAAASGGQTPHPAKTTSSPRRQAAISPWKAGPYPYSVRPPGLGTGPRCSASTSCLPAAMTREVLGHRRGRPGSGRLGASTPEGVPRARVRRCRRRGERTPVVPGPHLRLARPR